MFYLFNKITTVTFASRAYEYEAIATKPSQVVPLRQVSQRCREAIKHPLLPLQRGTVTAVSRGSDGCYRIRRGRDLNRTQGARRDGTAGPL